MERATSGITKPPVLGNEKLRILILSVISGLFASVMYFGDKYMSGDYLHTQSQIGNYVYLAIGASVGFVVNLILSTAHKGSLDNKKTTKYRGLNIGSGEFQWKAIRCGTMAAISTLAYIYAFSVADAIIVVALSSLSVGFAFLFDDDKPSRSWVILAILFLLPGVVLVSANNKILDGSINFNFNVLYAVGAMLVFYCLPTAYGKKVEKETALEDGEGNLLIWRFVWLLIVAAVLVFILVNVFGIADQFWPTLQKHFAITAIGSIAIAAAGFYSSTYRFKSQSSGSITEASVYYEASKIVLYLLLAPVLTGIIIYLGPVLLPIALYFDKDFAVQPVLAISQDVALQRMIGSALVFVACLVILTAPRKPKLI